jgi:hypothetical protein
MFKDNLGQKFFGVLLVATLLLVMLPPVDVAAQTGAGDITVIIKDLTGSDIPVGENVMADLWGVSRPKSGGGSTWQHMKKDAVDVGGVAQVTWTKAEIDAQVDITTNDFYFVISVYGGDSSVNTQVESPSGLWGQFLLYDPDLAAASLEVNVMTEPGFPGIPFSGFPTPTGIFYELDLSGVTYVDLWAAVNITYQGCVHDYQPVIEAAEKLEMEAEGYTFDFDGTQELLTITNAARGLNEIYSAREDGAGGYILELENVGEGTLRYDDTAKRLYVDIDYPALGLSNGDTYFVLPEFEMALSNPTYGTYTDLKAYTSFGYTSHALYPQVVQTYKMLFPKIFK